MKPWYENGLNFKCFKCGMCCSISGYVWLSKSDIIRISDYIKITKKDFLKKYTRYFNGKISLIEKVTGECIFLKDKKCKIYPVRPIQCKTFPFWPNLMREKEKFFLQKNICRGIDDPSFHFSKEEIEKKLLEYIENFSKKKS